jgi:hypothetical protein
MTSRDKLSPRSGLKRRAVLAAGFAAHNGLALAAILQTDYLPIMTQEEVARVVSSGMTVSDKIRALASGGLSRADIARTLRKRYQHVRNVLEADKLRALSPDTPQDAPVTGVSEPPARYGDVVRLRVALDGTVRLPPEMLQHLRARPGGVLISEIHPDGVQLLSSRAAMERARAFAASLNIDPSRVLSEELIAERRAEVAREEEEVAREFRERDARRSENG